MGIWVGMGTLYGKMLLQVAVWHRLEIVYNNEVVTLVIRTSEELELLLLHYAYTYVCVN